MNNTTSSPFKICLTMAGAVSAGAYTAGAISYLLETLELWESAKKHQKHQKDPSIPLHEVQLDTISGASAGGIVGTLMLIALLEGNTKKLEKAWVNMADEEKELTFAKMLQTGDIQEQKVRSLLNAHPLEQMADDILAVDSNLKYPNYVSQNLDLILTISNLRGLQFNIDFNGNFDESGTIITNHGGFFRYRIENEANPIGVAANGELFFVLDLQKPQHRAYLKSATLATSAFPIGLKSRDNNIPLDYLKRYEKYLFPAAENIRLQIPDEDPFHFSSVDGGLINNEPFGYALKVLQEKSPAAVAAEQYGMIMINPFPSFEKKPPAHQSALDIVGVAQQSFKALRNQVMFKQDDIFSALNESIRTRFLIAPRRRHSNGKVADHPLACGALAGFSGFLDASFRAHDFELGRQNCQSFLRYHFAIPVEEIPQKFNRPISKEAIERFSFTEPPRSATGKRFFPIIPDLRVTKAVNNQYDTVNFADAVLDYPVFPSISIKTIESRYKNLAKKRIGKIAKTFLNYPIINGIIRNRIYNYLIKEVEEGLAKHGLLG